MSSAERHNTGVAPGPFAVRRPIFDRHEHTVAYQLLAQGGVENIFPHRDPDDATRHGLAQGWRNPGLSTLIGLKKVCMSFTGDLLANGYAHGLPAGSAVINLSGETIEPEDDVLDECRRLQQMGYLIAVEDPLLESGPHPLISIADIVKVSFEDANTKEKYGHLRQIVGDRPRLLAAQVDTRDDYVQALELGFSLAQGDFYLKPETIEGRTIRGNRLNYFKLLEAANKPDLDVDDLDVIIGADLTLTHRLLKHLGSAVFGFRTDIRSVRHGLALLGQKRIQSFVSLVALAGMCDEKPNELLVSAAVRGKFCELIGSDVVLEDRESELFLVGALSLIDAMLDRPMFEVLEELPLPSDLKHGLLGGHSLLQPVLQFVKLYERGDWTACVELARPHGIVTTSVLDRYTDAVAWAAAALEV